MKATRSLLQVFQSRKMAAILLLGFASGLPFALMDDAFRAWMTKAQFDLSMIGWFSTVSLPYSLKFLWSPLLDRFIPPALGRRRGWIVLSQVALMGAIGLLAAQMGAFNAAGDLVPQLLILSTTALLVTFFSATQDIAIDAYRTDVLAERETGAGVATFVLGYRGALLLIGFVAFTLADRITWPWVYVLMAGVLGVGLITALWAPEPNRGAQAPESLQQAVVLPFIEFFQRLGWRQALFSLAFIIFFKIGDTLAAKMAVPFLGGKGLGFSDSDIGFMRLGVGLFATIIGTLTGGAFLSKLGINRSLWIFGGLQAVSNLGYFLLALAGQSYPVMALAVNVENFCGGLGTAGFLGFLMSLCNPSFSATQFALLSSLMAVGRDLIAGPASGMLAKGFEQWAQANSTFGTAIAPLQTAWALFFFVTFLAALPGLFLLPVFAPWNTLAQPSDRNPEGQQ